MIAGKVWGETENVFSNHNFEFHRIRVDKGGFCSKHLHKHKYNGFYVEEGVLVVSVWKSGYDLVDKTTICSGQFHVVPPQEYHQFEALEETYKDFSSSIQKDIFQYFGEFEKNKPKDAWYLEYLGVDPRSHSLGLGSLILKNSLSKIDDLHQPAYLESSNPRNMSLYERHGFDTVNKFQFGDGPPIHTMFREAR